MKYNAIKTKVAAAIKDNLHGYTIDDKTINVKGIKFDERNIHKQISWNHIQKVKNKNGTVSVPIIANIEIKKGNKVLSRDKNLNIGQLPIVIKNGTALVDGIEYTVPVQIRRDPGIYTSQSTNGTWKTMINSAKGKNFKVEMDPISNIQKIEIDGSRIPLIPILHHFGIKKDQIIKAWGGDKNAKDLYTLNERAGFTATGRKSLGTLYKKLVYGAHPSATDAQMKAALETYMKENSEFKPNTNKKTLGNPYKTLSPNTFLDISKKLVDSAKTGVGDDTENLIFKHIKTADDLIAERLNLDFKKKLTASLSRNLKNNTHVKDIVRPGFFTQSLKGFYKNSEISEPSEQINPLHMINTATKTTIKGEGGITDENTVNLDMKSLHPSYLGYLDPIHTPDGSAGLVNHLTIRTVKDKDGKFMNMFYNKKGKIQYASITQTWDAKVATPDQYIIKKDKKPIPKSTKIKVMQAGETKIVSPSAVDYIIAQSSQMFDPATNLVPFINSDSGNRVSMGAKFGEQSISLVNRETPNVSTVDEHGKEFIGDIGLQFAIKSPIKGVVKKIGKDFIEVKAGSKIEKVDLRNHMEMNQESYFHDEPVVKVGQKVNKGTILASNNWTDKKGNFLNGTNTRIAFLPYKGYSIEDGIIVSDSYAKKMASQHMHVEEINIKEGGLNLDKFKLNFKNKYPFEAFQKLDERGIVKKGVDVQKGDILIAYSKPIEFSEIDKIVGRLSKGFKSKSLDNSAVWNYDFPGHVVDVIKSGNLVKVKVKSVQPLQVTDKLALAHGNKGVVSAVVPDSQMPQTADGKPIEAIFNPNGTTCFVPYDYLYTKKGWKLIGDLTMDDELLCLINGKSEFHKPIQLNEYNFKGDLYGYQSEALNYLVTGNHRMYVRTRDKKEFKEETAEQIYGKCRYHKITAEYNFREYISGETIKFLDTKKYSKNGKTIPSEFDLLLFSEFLGWYLSEGHSYDNIDKNGQHHFKTSIAQSRKHNPDKCKEIEYCLDKMGIKWHYYSNAYHISNRFIFYYVNKLGLSNEKYIPEECWDWPKEALDILFETMIKGDGFKDIKKNNYIKYITVSEKLANGFEKLAILLDYNPKIYCKKKENVKPYYNKKINKTFYARHDQYIVNIAQKKEMCQKKWKDYNPFYKKYYEGKIYCPTVLQEKIFYKRKGCKPLWVLNSRINFGQAFEASLGKITEKTGKRYLLKNFEHPNNWEFVKNELKKHKISDTEVVIDPETGKELKSWNPAKKQFDHPFVGNAYVRKLVHQTRKKFDARGRGAYSAIDMPGKDPESSHYIGDSASKENPKSIDRLTTYSVLAHGGKDVIADMWNNKGQNRADVWESIISGAPIPPPRKSIATIKAEALMRAAGVNTERKGRFITSPPLTDKDTKEISSGKIEKPNLFLRGKDLIPIKGGMFDPILTGGMKNFDRYNHMDLGVKIPNPITKNAIKSLLDLSDSDFDDILKGDKVISGKTGSDYLESKLKEIDVEKTIKKLETDKLTAPKTKINTINRKLRYLRALRGSGIEPHEYMISKVPIIPTGFRPIITLPNGTIEPAPINQLYRDVAIASKLATDKSFPNKLKNEATHELYNTLSGLQGVTDPTINKQTTTRKLKSVLTELAGSGSPKGGFIHSKLLSKTQDYIGSSVIGVNPHLGLDEVGLPYEMAEKIYEPFLLKELRASGHKISDFSKLKKENPQVIKNILEKIVKERPVVINRNPSLHKGSVWGQNPVLITGKSIQVNPMILKPLNADFDGDEQISSVFLYSEFGIDFLKYYNYLEDIENQNLKKKIMSARFNVTTQFINSFDEETIKLLKANPESNKNFFVVNLENFPRKEIFFKKDHRTFYEVPEGIKVISYDEINKKYTLANVKYFSIHEDREVWTVTTSNKRQIVSDDDPRAVYGIDSKNGTFELKRFYPKESLGVMVPYAKSTEKIVIENEYITEVGGNGRLKEKIQLNKKVGYIVGTLIGDGWYDVVKNKKDRVNLSGIEKPIIEQYEQFLNEEIFKKSVNISHTIGNNSYGASEKHVICSVDFAEWIAPLIGKGAKNKHLPSFWFSAPRDFKIGLLSGLLDTDGSICITNGKSKPQLQLNISSISLRLLQECQQMLLSLGVSSKISFSKKTEADNNFWILSISSVDIQNIKNELNIVHEKNIKALNNCIPNENSPAYIKTDLVPLTKEIGDYLKNFVKYPESNYSSLLQGIKKGYISRSLAINLINKKSNKVDISRPNQWREFLLIVRNDSISWSPVIEFENTKALETGYDLTVPGYETFMSVDGTILSNTIIVSAPISKKAVEQVKTMIPSLNILSPKNDELNIAYDQEYMAGIALMTENGRKLNLSFKNIKELEDAYAKNKIRINDIVKVGGKTTSYGRLLMMKALPPELGYKGQSRITKKEMTEFLKKMVKDGSVSKYTNVINNIKDLGAKYAYDEGFSFSLDDIRPRKDIRSKYLNPFIPSIVSNKSFNIAKATSTAKNAQEHLTKELISEHNRAYLPSVYGSRNVRPDVMQQIVATPFFVSGLKGPINTPISKSYSEGLDLLDNFNASYGSRKAIVDKVNQVSEPGALSKELVATMSGEVITRKDCGTHDGVHVQLDDTFNLQNRVLAESVNGLPRNTILDNKHLQELRKGRTKNILVRSPLTCKAPKGVCAYSLYPESMVYVKDTNNKIYNISLEDLFNLVQEPIEYIEDIEQKYPIKWTIWGANGWENLERVLRHPKENRRMIEVGTDQGLSMIATDDHPHVVFRSKIKCKCGSQLFSIDDRYKEKKNRSKNPHILCKNCKNRFTVSEKKLNELEELRVLSSDLKLGDKLKIGNLNVEKIKDPDIDGYFLGLYLSEGSSRYRNGYNYKKYHSIDISQDESELKQYMFNYLSFLKYKLHLYKKTISTHNTKFVNELKNLLGSLELCDKKKLPTNWLEWSNEYIGDVLAGFIDGDGFIRQRVGNECLIGSTSYSILVQFQTWLYSQGIRASLKCKTQKPSHGVKTRKDFFHLTFSINQKVLDLLSKCYKAKNITASNGKYKVGGEYATIISLIDKSDKCQNYWVYDVTLSDSHKFYVNNILTKNCYGYNEHHQLPRLGDPIGLKAAQSIGETGTQSALSSHHLGGTVAAGSFRTGFDHTKFLLQMPQNVKAKATLAGEDGVVTSIKEGINKSNLVFIGKTSDPYICFNPLKVKVGSKVHAGDPLDQGPIKIQELVELAPMNKVQTHLVDQLEKSYSGTKILRRNTETIVRGVTQYSKVVKPGESPYLENELVPSNMVEWIKSGKKIDVDDVIGWKLKAQTGKYPAGTQITVDIANDLLKKGIKEVVVNANGLQIKNQTTNISSIPLIQPDFYKRLSFERIRNTMKEGPISGSYSNVHGAYPEPSLITGVDIGLESES